MRERDQRHRQRRRQRSRDRRNDGKQWHHRTGGRERDGAAAVEAGEDVPAVGAGPVPQAPKPVEDPDGGFIHYASARQMDRQAQQEQLIGLILRGTQAGDDMGVGSRLTGSMFTTEMLKVLAESRKS